ncbi:hypothetical protein E2C01_056991 [Portunus trituberculatus]|uniref:Uncharacterized protein n=1 Tax=Portunus trituberculatus TaxID=210409 RepID=A0A5B7GRU9_PORTR|nr:hypothetical protein [Portunus trituberculatus]
MSHRPASTGTKTPPRVGGVSVCVSPSVNEEPLATFVLPVSTWCRVAAPWTPVPRCAAREQHMAVTRGTTIVRQLFVFRNCLLALGWDVQLR